MSASILALGSIAAGTLRGRPFIARRFEPLNSIYCLMLSLLEVKVAVIRSLDVVSALHRLDIDLNRTLHTVTGAAFTGIPRHCQYLIPRESPPPACYPRHADDDTEDDRNYDHYDASP